MNKKFFGEWEIADKISEGSFSTVYKATRTDGTLAAIKYISFPKNKDDMDKIIKIGLAKDYQGANNYFLNIINKEIEIMKRFNGNPYIVDCYDVYQEQKPNGSGIDYYIRMEYVEDIKTYYSKGLIDIDEVVKLGIDICSALELCSSIKFVHGDIKPENIFIGSDGKYKLGDFSASFNTNKSGLKLFGTLNYIAPEVYKGNEISDSTDLYSLGIMMYQFVNGKLPFVSKDTDEKAAFDTRMSGTQIPVIRGVNKKLMDIILKACAFNEKDRYKSATEMKKDLEELPHLISKKIKVTFSSNSKYQNTVDINDDTLISNASNNATKVKMKFLEKRKVKLIISITIVVVIILFLLISCSLNRTCSVGYINRNGMCVKGYYYCDSGYSLNADNKCQKTIESIDAKVSYTCKSGYTLNGDVCVSNSMLKPEFVYKCADGYTLKGTKCEKTTSVDAMVTYSCPSSYVLAGDQCVTVTNVDATSIYGCEDSSYSLSGTTCRKTVTNIVPATVKYTCDAGGTLNGTVCDYEVEPTYSWFYYNPKCSRGTYDYTDRMCHYSESAKFAYACSQGELTGNNTCVYTTVDTKNAVIKYGCPVGYTVVGNQCAKTSGVAATPKYTCTDDMVLKNGKCYVTISADAVGTYACPDGYILSGGTCVEEDLPTPVKKYSCSRVYTLNGGKCEKYEIVKSKAYYYE